MKKFALVFMICISNLLSAYTQPQKIQLSKDYNIEKQKPPIVIGEDEKGLVAYHTFLKDEKIILELGYLNNEFEWSESMNIELDSLYDSPIVEKIEYDNGEFLIFIEELLIGKSNEVENVTDVDWGETTVSAIKANINTGEFSDVRQIMSFQTIIELGHNTTLPEIEISNNHNFYCIWYQEVKFNESISVYYVTMNDEMEIVNTVTHIEQEPKGMDITINEFDISNNGEVSFLVATKFYPVRKMRPEDDVTVLYFDKESSEGKRIKLEFNDKSYFVTENGCTKSFDDNGRIILAGGYSEGTKYYPVGVFYVVMQPQNNVSEFKYLDLFSQETILKWFTEEKDKQKAIKSFAKNKSVPLRKLEAKKCIFNKDGSLIVVFEQEYFADLEGLNTVIGDLIFVKFSADGSNVHWEYLLEKKQEMNLNDLYRYECRFNVEVNDDGDCFVIYNEGDYFDEINLDELEENGEHSIPNLVLVKISALGKEEFNDVILKSEEEGVIFDPASLRMVGNEKIYFWGKYSSNGVFAIIDI